MFILVTIGVLAYIAFCFTSIDYYVRKFDNNFVSLFLSLATFFVPIAVVFQICAWSLK
jgi:uncharacterized membrane protein YhfC